MNDEPNQRMERGNISSTSSDGRSKSSFVLPDGREVINYKNPATIVTVGLVSFVLLIGSTTVIGYRAGRSEVQQIVVETVPNIKLEPDRPTLRRQMYEIESNINECKKYEKRLNDVECYLKKGIGCK